MKNLMSCGVVVGLICGTSFGGGGDGCVDPVIVGSHEITAFHTGGYEVSVVGETAFVFAVAGGIDVFDVSVPSDPVSIGFIPVLVNGPYIFTFGHVVKGTTAFVAVDGIGFQGIWAGDFSDLSSVSTLGTIGVGENGRLIAAGDRLYSRYGGQGGFDSLGFRIFDIGDLGAISMVSETMTSGVMFDYAVDGTTLYAADGDSGLGVWDVNDATNPQLMGVFSEPGFHAREIVVVGTTAYVSGGREINVFDVVDPMNPALVGSFVFPDPSSVDLNQGNALSVEGDVVYAMNGPRETLVIDARDFSSMSLMGSLSLESPASDVVVDGGVGYFASGNISEGLLVADMDVSCNTCMADLNNDGELDFFDISRFLMLFGGQDLASDWNRDGVLDFFDVSGFLAGFAVGCP